MANKIGWLLTSSYCIIDGIISKKFLANYELILARVHGHKDHEAVCMHTIHTYVYYTV